MSLANFLLRCSLGDRKAPDTLDVALYHGAIEVRDPGYRRAEILKGAWRVGNDKANCLATFGPFRGAVTFDRSVVFEGHEVIDEKLLPGGARKSGQTDVLRLEIELDLTPPR